MTTRTGEPSSLRTAGPSPKTIARAAGLLYVIIILGGVFSLLYVPSSHIVPGDAATTASNIEASESLFRLGIVSSFFVLLGDPGVAVLLYVLYLPVSKTLSSLAAVLRLIHTGIYGITLLNYGFSLQLLSGDAYLAAFGADQLDALVMLFLDAFDAGYLIAQVFFAFSVLFLGLLVYQSGYFPRIVGTILGGLLVAACFAYLAESFGLSVPRVPGYRLHRHRRARHRGDSTRAVAAGEGRIGRTTSYAGGELTARAGYGGSHVAIDPRTQVMIEGRGRFECRARSTPSPSRPTRRQITPVRVATSLAADSLMPLPRIV